MNNISKLREQLLLDINASQVVESFTPTTLSCTNTKNAIVESINSGKLNSVTSILSIFEAINRHASIDSGAMKASDALTESLNAKSFEAKLVFCYESISQSMDNGFKSTVLEKLDTLAGMEVSEAKQAIRNGFLGSVSDTYRSEGINLIIQESAIATGNVLESTDYNTYSPVTYCVVESGNAFVRFGSRVFAINENQVAETKSPNEKFNYISNILEHVNFDAVNKTFVYEDVILGNIKVAEGNVTRTINEDVMSFGIDELSKKLSFIIEAANISKSDKTSYNNVIDALQILNENSGSIAIANNVLVVEHKARNEKFAMFNLGHKQYVAVLKSNFSPMITEEFSDPSKAIDFLKRRSGYDASGFVAEELTAHTALVNENMEIANGHVDIINEITSKITSIKEDMEVAKAEGNQGRLDALNETLQLAESLRIEQKNNLAEIVNRQRSTNAVTSVNEDKKDDDKDVNEDDDKDDDKDADKKED